MNNWAGTCIYLTHYYAAYNADILVLDPVQGDSLLDEVKEPCSETASPKMWSLVRDSGLQEGSNVILPEGLGGGLVSSSVQLLALNGWVAWMVLLLKNNCFVWLRLCRGTQCHNGEKDTLQKVSVQLIILLIEFNWIDI